MSGSKGQDGIWPNVIAPPQYENPAEGWEDPRLPDLQLIWKLGREVGYAIGIHGSLKRDVDLIASPWTAEAVGNAALVDHLCAGLPAARVGGPEHKPHGRVAVTLQIDGWFKPIDLSIMPRPDSAIHAAKVEEVKEALRRVHLFPCYRGPQHSNPLFVGRREGEIAATEAIADLITARIAALTKGRGKGGGR